MGNNMTLYFYVLLSVFLMTTWNDPVLVSYGEHILQQKSAHG